jgi:hypothetical protein
VPELLLRDLDRHAQIVEQGRVDMAELMPRYATEPRAPAAGWSTRRRTFDSRIATPWRFGVLSVRTL